MTVFLAVIAVICFAYLVARMIHIIMESWVESFVKDEEKPYMPINDCQQEDFEWFLEHYNEFYEQYGVCYLGIKNKEVIGIYTSYAEGVQLCKEQGYELGTFIIQYCNGKESGYTMYMYNDFIIENEENRLWKSGV